MDDILTLFVYIFSALLFAWCLKHDGGKKRASGRIRVNVYLVGAFLIIVLLGTFRDASVGKDTIQYVTLYSSPEHQATSIALDSYFKSEPGFALFVLILSKICSDYTFFFFVVSCIEGYAIIRSFRTFSTPNTPYWFLYALYFTDYVYSFSAIRFGLAVAFCMIAFCNIKDHKRVRAMLWMIIGALFHTTCLIMIVYLLFLQFEKMFFKEYMGLKIVLTEVLCVVLSTIAVTILAHALGDSRLTQYLEFEGSIWGQIPKIILAMIVFITSFIICNKQFKENRIEYWGVYFTAFLVPLTVAANISRILNYLYALRICAYKDTFIQLEGVVRPKSVLKLTIFVLTVIWLIFSFYNLKTLSGVAPYRLRMFSGDQL